MKRLLVPGIAILLAAAACSEPASHPPAVVLSAENADQRIAGYSPDGASLYWWERAGDGWQLWRSRSDMTDADSLPFHSQFETPELLWSPDGTRFVIGVDANTPFPVLWVMNADGAGARRVLAEASLQIPLVWHPDGRRLSYITFQDQSVLTMVADVQTGTSTRLLPGDTIPHIAVWAPDGAHLLINHIDQGRYNLFMADSSGEARREVLGEGLEQGSGWAPDGSAALFTSTRSGTRDIWLAPVDGSAPRQLTSDVRDDTNAHWSPDSKWVAFESTRGQQSDIWVVSAAGGEARRVTDDLSTDRLFGWRPKSSEVVFGTGQAVQTLWSHTLADGKERQLTNDTLDVTFFNLSAQGDVLLRINRGGGVNDLAVMPLAGGEPRVILKDARTDHARWSPSGSHLVFPSSRGGVSLDIWTMRVDGSDLRQLTRSQADEDYPLFGTTDSTIFFQSRQDARFGDTWSVPLSGAEPTRITHAQSVGQTCWQAWRNDHLIIGLIAPPPVTATVAHVGTDGTLQHLWPAGTAFCASVSPVTDTALVWALEADGAAQAQLVPISGGTARPVLARNQTPDTWSPDGREIAFSYSTNPPYDLGILTLATGQVRRITETSESEHGTEWTHDGSALIFSRVKPINRVTTADVTRLLEEKK